MIRTYSTTIRRKEMDAVLTCMVDEKIGPGELNMRLIQLIKEFFKCDGAVALRSPAIALKYALKALDVPTGTAVMISALAPSWQIATLEDCGYVPLVLDVDESNGLVAADIVSEGIKRGGRVLLLHEAFGILPDVDAIMQLGIPVIEDISQSVGASFAVHDENARFAGSFGTFAILGLEERDVITSGGGAVIMAHARRDWIPLKKYTDVAPLTDLLPDLNAALAWVELKEFKRNEEKRREIFTLFQRSCMSGRHKLLARDIDSSTMSAFPLVLSSAFRDVKHYAERKDIEIRLAFENSVISLRDESFGSSCISAKSLALRCVLFPLYPRLTHAETEKIVKVLGTLP
ncbi:MAG: DegT/DnrJ/EryC1/StrS aminotransferase family protein [Treponema sp.]|nr:DegT/DnrJ/EryC1/StrS aminotransferase family protein [Treponema sp.]